MKIAMTGVFVDEPNKAIDFYTEVLGFEVKEHRSEMQLAVVGPKNDPRGTVLLLEPNATEYSQKYKSAVYNAGLPIIVFGTDDLDREFEKLSEKGVKFPTPPTKTEWGYQAVFDDTFGNLIMLIQNQ